MSTTTAPQPASQRRDEASDRLIDELTETAVLAALLHWPGTLWPVVEAVGFRPSYLRRRHAVAIATAIGALRTAGNLDPSPSSIVTWLGEHMPGSASTLDVFAIHSEAVRPSADDLSARVRRLASFERARQLRDVCRRAVAGLTTEGAPALTTWRARIVETASEPDDSTASAPLVTLGELAAQAAPAYLVSEIIPAGSLGMLWAPPGRWKTFVAVDLAASVVTGRSWLSWPIRTPGPVVILAGEGIRGLPSRFEAWALAHGRPLETAPIFVWRDECGLLDELAVARLIAALRPVQPRLVTIDTWSYAIAGANENDHETVSLALRSVRRIRRALDAAVLIVHHAAKNGESERGHTALRGEVDYSWTIHGDDDVKELRASKALRDGAELPTTRLVLQPVPAAGSAVVRLATEVRPSADDLLTAKQQTTLDTLRRFGHVGASARDLEAALPPGLLSRRGVFDVLARLKDRGLVRQSSRGPYVAPPGDGAGV